MYKENSIEKAVSVANKAHSGQLRKGTMIPYILHVLETGSIASSLLSQVFLIDYGVIMASILHDTLEDTELTEEDLLRDFDQRVVDLVAIQSENKSLPWKARKEHTIKTLKETTKIEVSIVHLADKLSNMRAISRDYSLIGDKLWDRFNEKDKNEHAWYYSAIAENTAKLAHTNEHKEFVSLVEDVFGCA